MNDFNRMLKVIYAGFYFSNIYKQFFKFLGYKLKAFLFVLF